MSPVGPTPTLISDIMGLYLDGSKQCLSRLLHGLHFVMLIKELCNVSVIPFPGYPLQARKVMHTLCLFTEDNHVSSMKRV